MFSLRVQIVQQSVVSQKDSVLRWALHCCCLPEWVQTGQESSFNLFLLLGKISCIFILPPYLQPQRKMCPCSLPRSASPYAPDPSPSLPSLIPLLFSVFFFPLPTLPCLSGSDLSSRLPSLAPPTWLHGLGILRSCPQPNCFSDELYWVISNHHHKVYLPEVDGYHQFTKEETETQVWNTQLRLYK